MPLLNAERVYALAEAYRLVWIGGRFGGGKTSLAFKLAEHWLRKGYKLAANVKSVWNDPPSSITPDDFGKLRLVTIIDEGGTFMKSTAQVEAIAAYAAKMDVIYILPSFYPPPRRWQVLNIYVWFTLKHVGIPITFYKYLVKAGAFKDTGTFAWWRPSEIWGVYSRQDPGDPEILDWLSQHVERFQALHGRQSVWKMPETSLSSIATELGEVIDEFAEVVQTTKRRRRRRF